MQWLTSRLQALLASSRGLTLAEVLVSLGILGVSVGLVGGGIFQALRFSTDWTDNVVAVKEVRHAASWFAGDALNAETTDLTDGASPVSSVVITWIDSDSVAHTATYSLVDNRLVRNYDGAPITVARDVVSVGFSRSGQILRLDLTVEAAAGETKSTSMDVYGRVLQ